MRVRHIVWVVAVATLAGAPGSHTLTPRAVLTPAEADEKASVTSDGRFLAMTDWSSGDIAVRDLATGRTKRLMAKRGGWESDDLAEYVILSPDQRQVVFVWHEGSTPGQLCVMASDPGSRSRVLVRNSEFPYVLPAAWSTDGKSVLVHLWKKDYTAQIAWVSVADGSLTVLRSLEWRGAPLKIGRPSLSPDGRYIAYAALESSGSPDSHIYILAADGSAENEVVEGSGVNEAPVWTPDGANLLFTSNRGGGFGLWSLAVREGKAAGTVLQVKADIGRIYPLGLARSGSLYYVQERGAENVFLANMAEGGARIRGPLAQLSAEFPGSNRGPAWSPDGNLIAFKRRAQGNRAGYLLVVHSLLTAEEKTYADDSLVGTPARPVWFRDGKGLQVAMTDNQNRISFHRVDRETGRFTELAPADPSYLALSALSPDQKTIYVATRDDKRNKGGIAALDLNTGQRTEVFATPGFVNNFALSPDGRLLAIARSIPSQAPSQGPSQGHWAGRLSRVAMDGSGLADLYSSEQDIFGGGPMLAWTTDGRAVLFGQGAHDWQLMRVPAGGGKAELMELGTTGLRHDLSISPDGSRVAFGHGKYGVKQTWALDHVWDPLP